MWRLYLGLFQLLVVVSLQLDEGAEDVLVLVGILVAQQHMLGLLVYAGLLQVLQSGCGVFLKTHSQTTATDKECCLLCLKFKIHNKSQ